MRIQLIQPKPCLNKCLMAYVTCENQNHVGSLLILCGHTNDLVNTTNHSNYCEGIANFWHPLYTVLVWFEFLQCWVFFQQCLLTRAELNMIPSAWDMERFSPQVSAHAWENGAFGERTCHNYASSWSKKTQSGIVTTKCINDTLLLTNYSDIDSGKAQNWLAYGRVEQAEFEHHNIWLDCSRA